MDLIKLVIVTPAHNEAVNIENLSVNLASLKFNFEVKWIVVDDNSSDGTSQALRETSFGKSAELVTASTSGRLIEGGAFAAWNKGVRRAYDIVPDFTHLMKLDADVILDREYFVVLEPLFLDGTIGILGGVIVRGGREQNFHVPGPVKIYSRACLEALHALPLKPGFDVMDEVAAGTQGFRVVVDAKAKIYLNRRIGGSQGALHGRRRNGLICRWVGYDPIYFLLHLARYSLRKPYIFGSLWMGFGFLTAGPSPYSHELRKIHAASQRKKLKNLCSNPVNFIYSTYSTKKR
jgi:glycosyltransferase involved in cell wall biosynthesis